MIKFEKRDLKRLLVVCFASAILALNLKTFVRIGDLYPAGVTGLTILVQRAAEEFFDLNIPFTLISVIFNAVPIFIGFRFIGKKFTLFSCLAIVLIGVLTDLIPSHALTHDILLISVFGGIISGAASSLILLVDATTGGTDFIAIFLSEKKGMDSFNIILLFNIVILLAAGFMFGWDKALYSIIYQYAATQILHLLFRRFQQATLYIVTNSPQKICDVIFNICHHGATIMAGEGSYEHAERSVVYSVVSLADTRRIAKAVRAVDPNAFVNIMRTEHLYGSFYQRPED